MNPRYVAMAFDVGRDTTFRREIFPPYKAHRKPHPFDLTLQVTRNAQGEKPRPFNVLLVYQPYVFYDCRWTKYGVWEYMVRDFGALRTRSGYFQSRSFMFRLRGGLTAMPKSRMPYAYTVL